MIGKAFSVLMLLVGLAAIIFRLVASSPLTVWGTRIAPNYVLLAGIYLIIFGGLILFRLNTRDSAPQQEE